jgi:hypothetical protein
VDRDIKRSNCTGNSYKVLTTLVLTWLSSSAKSLAKTKSMILGLYLLSSKILLALISLWMIRISDSS